MNIPDEAVEAAHEQFEAMGRYLAKDEVEAALYAAEPYLMAQAWDEREKAQYEIRLTADGTAWEPVKPNPYRTVEAGE